MDKYRLIWVLWYIYTCCKLSQFPGIPDCKLNCWKGIWVTNEPKAGTSKNTRPFNHETLAMAHFNASFLDNQSPVQFESRKNMKDAIALTLYSAEALFIGIPMPGCYSMTAAQPSTV